MIDLANDPVVFGDLTLDSSNDDLMVDSSSIRLVLSEIREMFEMTIADDIDYPEIYSRQRAAANSTEYADQAARIRDAEKFLKFHPAIDARSIDVSLNSENRILVSFFLKTGESLKGFVMSGS
ncbi:hypothetical protein A0128_00975 [Leptospira tipperaryensis]|uniref:Uncharacterized protein n=1 Tax=Leptospira tipperaryensis TaxID=2564040 RepID=A0A1D7USG9_9LEPT|nr:hypothetical protein [Leptospira tipperaryensis]AOP32572.1 hypothetical protein A0128_00975 [Leptospira tipperaryensis]